MVYLLGLAILLLAACAAVPPDDYRTKIEHRAAELTDIFNAWAGTNYDVPSISWFTGPCEDGPDLMGVATDSEELMQNVGGHMVSMGTVELGYIELNTTCALKDPDAMLTDTLPHELAHVFCAKLYPGADHGHDAFWQLIAVKLGVPRTNQYITDPTVRAGGS